MPFHPSRKKRHGFRAEIGFTIAGVLAFTLAAACGSSAGSGATNAPDASTTCPVGQTYCTTCQGSGVCAAGCPNIECPRDAGTASSDGGTGDGGADDGGATDASTSDDGSLLGDAFHTCVPLSCEGLGCECGECTITICGSGTTDCGGCEGGATCVANQCVAATDAGDAGACVLPDGGASTCGTGEWVCCKRPNLIVACVSPTLDDGGCGLATP